MRTEPPRAPRSHQECHHPHKNGWEDGGGTENSGAIPPHKQRQPLRAQATCMEHADRDRQAGHGISVWYGEAICTIVHIGRAVGILPSIPLSSEKSMEPQSLETNTVTTCHNGYAEAQTHMEGPQPFCAEMDLLRRNRDVQTFGCGISRTCKCPKGLREEGESLVQARPAQKTFWASGQTVWEKHKAMQYAGIWEGNLSVISALTLAHQQSCLKSLQGEETKQASSSEKQTAKTSMKETGPLFLFGAEGRVLHLTLTCP